MTEKRVARLEDFLVLKRRIVDVEVPELGDGVVVRLRELPIGAVDNAREDTTKTEELSQMIVDENGELLFNSPAGLTALLAWPLTVGIALLVAANKLNLRTASSLEEAKKNLESSPSASSESALPVS